MLNQVLIWVIPDDIIIGTIFFKIFVIFLLTSILKNFNLHPYLNRKNTIHNSSNTPPIKVAIEMLCALVSNTSRVINKAIITIFKITGAIANGKNLLKLLSIPP